MTQEQKGQKCLCCLIAGAIILALGLFADVMGIGESIGYGPKQLAAIALGLLLIVYGTKEGKSGKFCVCKKKEEEK